MPSRQPGGGDRRLARNTLFAGVALACLACVSAGVALSSRGASLDPDADNSTAPAKAFRMALVDPAPPQVSRRDPRAPLATPGPSLAANSKAPKSPHVQLAAIAPMLPPQRPAHLARADATAMTLASTGAATADAARADMARIDVAKAEAEAAAAVKDIAKTVDRPETVAAAPTAPAAQDTVPDAAAGVALDTVPDTKPAARTTRTAAVYFASAPLADSMTTGALGPLLDKSDTGDSETRDDSAALPAPQHDAPLLAPTLAYAAPEPHRARTSEKLALAPALPPRKSEPQKRAKPGHKLTAYEKLYGGPVRLASLGPVEMTPNFGADGLPRAPYDRQTAVYIISEKKVYLPDGTVLEAHSGLGDKMDDPRFVHVRMRGATPPHVYRLKMREALFHGVEAIRMLPLNGEEAIFGRDGILAHTYMLGPSGQSNGCISFRDYDTFLEAFKAGKISQIAVLAKLD